MIDSTILQWAFVSYRQYIFHYRYFPWNIQAKEHLLVFMIRLVTYLNKCLPIEREGDSKHKELIMAKIKYLLNKNELFILFPEGTRSRTGRIAIDDATYGVGSIKEMFLYKR